MTWAYDHYVLIVNTGILTGINIMFNIVWVVAVAAIKHFGEILGRSSIACSYSLHNSLGQINFWFFFDIILSTAWFSFPYSVSVSVSTSTIPIWISTGSVMTTAATSSSLSTILVSTTTSAIIFSAGSSFSAPPPFIRTSFTVAMIFSTFTVSTFVPIWPQADRKESKKKKTVAAERKILQKTFHTYLPRLLSRSLDLDLERS